LKSSKTESPPLLEVGYVARAHGVRGELRAQLHAADSTILFDVDTVWLNGVAHEVESARPTSGAVLLALADVLDKDAADALKGAKIEVRRDAIPMEPGEYLVADLPGCEVIDETGASLGTVHSVIPGGQDLLVIRDAKVERLLPLVPEFVRAVDLAAKKITVALPEDLPVEPLRR
jgi:16S rRNA processing protein RimM